MDNVDNPLEIQADISRRLSILRQKESDKVAGEQKQIIGEYISEYHNRLQEQQQNQYPVYDKLPSRGDSTANESATNPADFYQSKSGIQCLSTYA